MRQIRIPELIKMLKCFSITSAASLVGQEIVSRVQQRVNEVVIFLLHLHQHHTKFERDLLNY